MPLDDGVPSSSLVHLASGSLSFLGASGYAQVVEPVGPLLFSGLSDNRTSALVLAAGQVSVFGLATSQTAALVLAAGQVSVSGSGGVVGTVATAAVGRLSVSGVAAAAVSYRYPTAGQVSVVGLGGVFGTRAGVAAGGGVSVTGATAQRAGGRFRATGALAVSGLASYVTQDYAVQAAGVLSLSGAATVTRSNYDHSAAGQLSFVGEATVRRAGSYFGGGRLAGLSGLLGELTATADLGPQAANTYRCHLSDGVYSVRDGRPLPAAVDIPLVFDGRAYIVPMTVCQLIGQGRFAVYVVAPSEGVAAVPEPLKREIAEEVWVPDPIPGLARELYAGLKDRLAPQPVRVVGGRRVSTVGGLSRKRPPVIKVRVRGVADPVGLRTALQELVGSRHLVGVRPEADGVLVTVG
jgi:hypothetical protein